ncbi:hypothetical protein BH18VER1_BH18VER1_21820 [soil metagenome]
MKSFLRLAVVVAAPLIALAAPPSTPPAPPLTADPVAADQPKSATSAPHTLLTIDFPGGSIAQLVAKVSESGATPFNVIGEKADLATQLPPFSVRNAELTAVASALGRMLARHGFMLMAATPDENTVYTVNKSASVEVGPKAFKSFQMAPYLQSQPIDAIVDAIRVAWQLDAAHDPKALELKYHPATTLLLASGSSEAVALVGTVISSMKPGVSAAETNSGAPTPPPPPTGK